jgi:hypothetical protein
MRGMRRITIQNSKFKIQNSKFKIQNSKFKIKDISDGDLNLD